MSDGTKVVPGRSRLDRKCKRKERDPVEKLSKEGFLEGVSLKLASEKKDKKVVKKPRKARAVENLERSVVNDGKKRCYWACKSDKNREYHDVYWGHALKDTKLLFEILSLCSQQAGVSWNVVWSKREAYRNQFHAWDMEMVAAMDEKSIEALCTSEGSGVMRNRKKLSAIINNAKICLEIERTFPGGLSGYLWSFSKGDAVLNKTRWEAGKSMPTESELSKEMAKTLKDKGFKFLGSITLYAFLQQVGIVNDHCVSCFVNPLSSSTSS